MSTLTSQINHLPRLQILKGIIERKKGYKTLQLFGNSTNGKKVHRTIRHIKNFVNGELRGGVNNTFPRYRTGTVISNGNRMNIGKLRKMSKKITCT